VEKRYRRKGIAQKLLEFVIDNNRPESVSLEVRADNNEAINFYLKNGFQKVSIREKYYGSVDGYLMVKKVK
jgi:ribosomal-protein-alanine N-acetyltransferase